MSTRKEIATDEQRRAEAVADATDEARTPGRLTFAENVIATVKILAAFGLLGAALWGFDLWLSAK